MKYNPKLAATIHNPYPLSRYPIKKGTRVVYLSTVGRAGNPAIQEGRVEWYNPATHDTYMVTKGQPFYKIDGEIVGAENVRRKSKRGEAQLTLKLGAYYEECANDLQNRASAILAEARRLMAHANKLLKRKK